MNSFGKLFKVEIFGESHGPELGVLIDGCPAGMPLKIEDFYHDLKRRKSGSTGTTPRREDDSPEITSGMLNNKTTGCPLLITFKNRNQKSDDYKNIKNIPRPGHADYTACKKFGGYHDYRGGGHFSGRLTLALVAAGVLAKKIISPLEVTAGLIEVGGSENIQEAVAASIADKDSIGGIIECRVTRIMAGLGEPFFDSLESLISHMVFAIPGIRGIEFGAGFKAAGMKGSKHNDAIINSNGKTETNFCGGINGGISNGNPLYFRVAVKPTASIPKEQNTLNLESGKIEKLTVSGRHDTCFALRVPVIVEAVTAIVLADLILLEQKVARIWNKGDN